MPVLSCCPANISTARIRMPSRNTRRPSVSPPPCEYLTHQANRDDHCCQPRRQHRFDLSSSEKTAHRRFSEWTKARIRAELYHLVLDELGSRGELDWSRCAIDSVNMRARKRGT
jgi:hypothetical protein